MKTQTEPHVAAFTVTSHNILLLDYFGSVQSVDDAE